VTVCFGGFAAAPLVSQVYVPTAALPVHDWVIFAAMGQSLTEAEQFQLIAEVSNGPWGLHQPASARQALPQWYQDSLRPCVLLFAQVDSDLSGSIDFGEFIQVIEKQKERASRFSDESDMIDAFVACGGNEDKSGCGE
jgi:hypothetical protein